VPGRQFRYKISSKILHITFDPAEGESIKVPDLVGDMQSSFDSCLQKYLNGLLTWRIVMYDSGLPVADKKEHRLFPEFKILYGRLRQGDKFRGRSWVRGGALDATICPSQADAELVATEACRLLNKYPLDILDTDFIDELDYVINGRSKPSEMTSIVELMSLQAISKEFDFRTIRWIFRHTLFGPSAYNLQMNPPGGAPGRKKGFLISYTVSRSRPLPQILKRFGSAS
jgi:hypothetical protein